MSKLTASEVTLKHAKRLKASLEDIRQGIDRVTESPMEKAAAKQEKMKTKLIASIDSGKWADNLKSVPLQEWKTKFKEKGVGRISTGIDGASAKMENFFGQLLPHIDTGVAQVKKMSDLTLDDSIARMETMTRHMSKFRFKKS